MEYVVISLVLLALLVGYTLSRQKFLLERISEQNEVINQLQTDMRDTLMAMNQLAVALKQVANAVGFDTEDSSDTIDGMRH